MTDKVGDPDGEAGSDGGAGGFTTADRLEQYKAYLQDFGNIGSRHEIARGFYLSILTALLALSAYAGDGGSSSKAGFSLSAVVGLGGCAISILWIRHTWSLGVLFAVKFQTLEKIEEALPFQIYGSEYKKLKGAPESGREERRFTKYISPTSIECFVGFVFFILFALTIAPTGITIAN